MLSEIWSISKDWTGLIWRRIYALVLGGDAKNIDFLLEAYKDFTFDDVQVILEGLRSVSGFPIPDQKQVSGALADLRIFHAKAAVSCLIATKNPGEVLTETVEMFLAWGDDNVEHLLDLIVREYDAWSQPFLATIREKNRDGNRDM